MKTQQYNTLLSRLICSPKYLASKQPLRNVLVRKFNRVIDRK